jgi:hypothetical protein
MTMSTRFDLYTLIHKAQRKKLFDLITDTGRLSPHAGAARESLVADLRLFLAALVVHAEAEDHLIGPLLVACAPEKAAHIDSAHRKVDGLIVTVQTQADAALASPSAAEDGRLYRALCQLAMFYLEHVDAEEHIAQPALWQHHDDAKLAATQALIVAAHDPATVAYNMRCMLPAITPEERIGFLSGMKQRLPPPAFAGMRASVAAFVADDEWRAIDAA